MSMNLHASINGMEIQLWQTPTFITKMICIGLDDKISSLEGTEAYHAMLRYIAWVKGTTNGVYYNEDNYQYTKEKQMNHIQYVYDLIEGWIDKPHFKVWAI